MPGLFASIWTPVSQVADEDAQGGMNDLVLYPKTMPLSRIKQKKRILKSVLSDQRLDSPLATIDAQREALDLAIRNGCYFSVEVLWFHLSKNSLLYDIEAEKQRLRILAFLRQSVLIEQLIKDDLGIFGEPLDPFYENLELRQSLLENPETAEEYITELLRATNTYEAAKDFIDARTRVLIQHKRPEHIKMAFLSSLCPAFTLASSLAVFGNFGAVWLAPALSLIVFPAVYLPLVYFSYKKFSIEYDALVKEKSYRIWATAQWVDLQRRYREYNDAMLELNGQMQALWRQHEGSLAAFTAQKNQLVIRQNELNILHNALLLRKTSLYNDLLLPNSLKLRCQELSEERFYGIEKKGAVDTQKNAQWGLNSDGSLSGMSYILEVLCPLGAGISFTFGGVATCILATIGFAFLGAGLAAFLSTPAGIVTASLIVGIILGLAIGYLLKPSHAKTKAPLGERNKEFFLAHTKCKRQLKKADEESKKSLVLRDDFNRYYRACRAKETLLSTQQAQTQQPTLPRRASVVW